MADLTLAAKIQAIVTGLQNVEALTAEVTQLAQAANIPLADPTPPLKHGADSTSISISSLVDELSKLASLSALLAFLKSSVEALRESEKSFQGLSSASHYAGISIQDSFGAASKLASDGLMSVGEASTSLQNLLNRGYDLSSAIAIIERLKDAAAFNRQANLAMGEAVVGATEGLKNENSMLVDNAGVTKNVAAMWEDYAKKIGVTTESLTKQQKIQAEQAGIMEETAGQVGNAAKAAEGLEGGFARLRVKSTELQTALGGDLQPALQMMGGVLEWIIELGKGVAFAFNAIGVESGALVASILQIQDAMLNGSFEGLGQKIAKNFDLVDQQLLDVAIRYDQGLTPAIQAATTKTKEQTKATDDQAKAQAQARQADKDREEGLKQYAKQAELNNKLAEAQSKLIAEVGKTREAGLVAQVAAAKATADEAEKAGLHAKALAAEREALELVGKLATLRINNARAEVEAKQSQAEAADALVQALTDQAYADGELTMVERAAIAGAEADAAAKRGQAEAARLHLAELVRMPDSLRSVADAQARQNAEVKRLYTEAQNAKDKLTRLRTEQAAGKATAEQVATAETNAAAAVQMLGEASLEAAKKTRVLNAERDKARTSEQANQSASKERQNHENAIYNQQQANRAKANQGLSEMQKAEAAVMHDGEQVTLMFSSLALEFWRFGEAGKKAFQDIDDALGLGTHHYDVWAKAAGEWIRQADKQAAAAAKVTEQLTKATQSGKGLREAIAAADIDTSKLGDEQMKPFLQALDAAKAKAKGVEESLASMLQSGREQLAQLKGEMDTAEQLQFNAKMKQLQQQLDNAPSQTAVGQIRELMRIEREAHAIRMGEIEKEQSAKAASSRNASGSPSESTGAGGQAHTIVERVFQVNLGGVALTGPASQASAFDEYLRSLGHQAETMR